MEDCIFCKIVAKQIPSNLVYEDDTCIAFHDIHPQAKVHILVIPKKHIPTFKDVENADEILIGNLMKAAQKVGRKFNLENYKLQMNVGREAGQVIFHIHLHIMSSP